MNSESRHAGMSRGSIIGWVPCSVPVEGAPMERGGAGFRLAQDSWVNRIRLASFRLGLLGLSAYCVSRIAYREGEVGLFCSG